MSLLFPELHNPLAPVVTSLAVTRTADFQNLVVANSYAISEPKSGNLQRSVNDLADINYLTSDKNILAERPIVVQQIADRALVAKFIRESGLITLTVERIGADGCFAVADNEIGFSQQFLRRFSRPMRRPTNHWRVPVVVWG